MSPAARTPDTAAAQLRRILHLIPELADDADHPIAEVASRLGTDRATLLKDLYAISERYGDPAGFVEGVAICIEEEQVSVHASHFLRPMRLTLAELGALELGLAMLGAERPPEEHRAIDGARARLRDVIAALPAEATADELRAVGGGAPADVARLAVLRGAVREHRVLALDYRKADAAADERRTIHPYALVHASGRWYLVGHSEESGGVRVFRLDRIRGATALERTFEPPADFALDELVRDGRVFRAEAPERLVVRYGPRVARWVAEREGRALAEDGSLTLEHPLADQDWAVRHVLQYGPDAEVLEPASVRAALVERLREMRVGAP
ncbi:MAG TPA: WYL domain-containing protein [Gemmatimonadales bacterium]|nr:WYL domain-containing protein [Gemmatimonadales bacterium]